MSRPSYISIAVTYLLGNVLISAHTIASMRKMRGMSQEQLAEKAGMRRTHLSNIEAPNVVHTLSLEILYNIADALDVRAGDLLNTTYPETNK